MTKEMVEKLRKEMYAGNIFPLDFLADSSAGEKEANQAIIDFVYEILSINFDQLFVPNGIDYGIARPLAEYISASFGWDDKVVEYFLHHCGCDIFYQHEIWWKVEAKLVAENKVDAASALRMAYDRIGPKHLPVLVWARTQGSLTAEKKARNIAHILACALCECLIDKFENEVL